MVKVTDKNMSMNASLVEFLNLCARREKLKWDNCIVIDGRERSGKTTLAIRMGYYYAWKNNKTFSVDNVFFEPEKMIKFATTNRNKVIIWDEAAFGGLSSEWQNRIQQQLIKMLMVAGKYGHFYIFIIPSFFKLKDYLAIDRSFALLHVYSPDFLTRGSFFCLNENEKTWVYYNNRKSRTYGKSNSFSGTFSYKDTDRLIDLEAYEKKKDEAIMNVLTILDDSASKRKEKINELKYFIAKNLPKDVIISGLKICDKTYYNWLEFGKEAQNKPNSLRKT